MKLPDFEFKSPGTVDEAVAMLMEADGEAKLLAGGQTLLPVMAFRLATPAVLVDLSGVATLKGIRLDDRGVHIGAMTTWRDIEDDHRLKMAAPLVSAVIEHIAHYQIRNRGTIGGSLSHADPSAEMPGVVVACDALVEIASSEGTRLVPAHEFFQGPLTTCLGPAEILTTVHFPLWPATRSWAFEDFAQRRGDFAYAGIALHYETSATDTIEDAHIGLIGATSVPRRLTDAEVALNGRRLDEATMAGAACAASIAAEAEDDLRASGAYRKALVSTLVERALIAASTRVFRA
jgi:aerobic carbon-monoxide dehydrogenase medium subunit